MWGRHWCLALGILLLAGAPVLADELRVVVAKANVRAEPSASSALLATLDREAVVEQHGRSDDWYRVRIPSSGIEGYVHETLVEAVAKPSTPGRSRTAAEPELGFRAFGQGGYGSFNASESFDAIFGSSSASSYGFGAELRYRRFFLQINRDSLDKTGERVFVAGSETFPLGIEDRLQVTPISVIVGYRFWRRGALTLLGGAGVGSHAVKEEWEFALPSETVDESFTSYHVLFGVEYALHRWVALRAEGQYATVPDSAGVGGVSEVFGESNLGGPSFRIKLLVGR